jgi:hypothetical protein
MSDPHPSSGNTAQAVTRGFLFHDWDLSEKGTITEIPPFDGKIIARMPDLGSESLTKNIEGSKSPSFWEKIGGSLASMIQGNSAIRQPFLHIGMVIGCVALLYGIGFFLLERESTPTENVPDIMESVAQSITNSVVSPMTESVAIVGDSGRFTPIMQPGGIISPPTIPGAPIEGIATMPSTMPPTVPPPASNSTYSPWNVAARQPESAIPEAPILTETVSGQVAPYVAVAMAPMIDMSASMPVSPHEQQLYAQPPTPVDPFVQRNTGVVPGRMPTHERPEHASGVMPAQNVQRSVSPPLYPQYVPPSAVQNMYGQPGHPNPHIVPPNTPIPSGVSTLSPQGGYPPHQPGDFYYAPPHSSYRRVY